MMKIFSFLLLSCVAVMFSAQSVHDKTASDLFQDQYNSGNYDGVFNSFTIEMQKALPLEETKKFLSGLKLQFGKIESKEFIAFRETYAAYKTNFEKAVLIVNISLNEHSKINGFFVKPYEKQDEKKESAKENTTVNALQNLPENVKEAIFLHIKAFPNNTQLSIAFIENGRTQFFGIIKENDKIKSVVNKNKVFEIGSVTKVFTSTVLASLAQNKKIDLNDDINSYYAFPFKVNNKISFLSLANHTSGLPRLPDNLSLSNTDNPYKNYGKKEIETYLKHNLQLNNDLLKYDYSNLGAGLLGYTLGESQRTSFQQLLQKSIFDKYKMKNSYTSSENLNEKLVSGLSVNGEKVNNWDFDVLFGGGGILSTAEDLAKFVEAQFDPKNKELALTRKSTFSVNEKMEIGLGWHILKDINNKDFFWHNGGTAGYSSSLAFNVENRNAVIILSNVSAFHSKMQNIDQLCFKLMNIVDEK